MAKGLNKVQLIGNLGDDPELRSVNDSQVCNIRLATTERYKSGDEWKDRTDWHSVEVWGKLADVCQDYLHKGSRVYFEGSLSTRSYEKDGEKRWVTSVKARDMIMLDQRPDAPKEKPKAKADDSFSPDDDLPF